ncbi:MAG: hypothetical protein ACI8SR_000038 [Oceanicoccus sp.]
MKLGFSYLLLLSMNVLSVSAIAQEIVFPNSAVVSEDDPYFIQHSDNTRLIYTQETKPHAEHAAAIEKKLQPLYEATFGYQLDTPLSVGLISSNNQIANGFSTQYPTNRQVNYMGGAQIPDYFSSSSWLDTLLLHETAHNYQTNAKNNPVSRGVYNVFRNGNIFLPFFPAVTPNVFESSFILEGNAVLNESWHGRGGRLYSGRYRAMTNVQANAGNLKKEVLYNQSMNFPYREGHYIFGGHYQYFLAETYGLDKTNEYFKNRSRYWYFPFSVNKPTQKTFRAKFDKTFDQWVKQTTQAASAIHLVEGEVLGRAKYYSDMNTQQGDVLFLASQDGVSKPVLHQYNMATQSLTSEPKALSYGRVFLQDDEYYTVNGRATSPWKITQGLFDDTGYIKKGTEGKIIQGYMHDGRAVYFDVPSSFVSPQLYVGDEFYQAVNSSVVVKDDHLYYFKQEGNKRTLYRDNQALYTLEGFYSIVADVDNNGAVYFIANSPLGSSVYKVKDQQVSRVSQGDNVVAAKLAGNDQLIVEAISADDYYYALTPMVERSENPFVVSLMWDNPEHPLHAQLSYFDDIEKAPLKNEESYGFFNSLDYTAGNLLFAKNEDGDSVYDFSVVLADPLTYHEVTFRAQRDEEKSVLLGTRYSNNQHFLLYGIESYYVAKDGLEDYAFLNTRDYGLSVDLKLPFLRSGFWGGSIDAGFYQDYKNVDREPLSLNLAINRAQAFGHSFYFNELLTFNAYGTEDRGDHITGAALNVSTSFSHEIFAGVKAKYSESDGDISQIQNRGVELNDAVSFLGKDPSAFVITSLKQDVYAKSVNFSEVNISKVFNGSAYYFKFPLSLQREAVSLAYRHYDIDVAPGINPIEINQASLKLSFDSVLMNIIPVRFVLESVYNDSEVITDETRTTFGLELSL